MNGNGFSAGVLLLIRLNPTLDEVYEWLERAGEPHTYDEIPGIHDHNCRACQVLRVLRESNE